MYYFFLGLLSCSRCASSRWHSSSAKWVQVGLGCKCGIEHCRKDSKGHGAQFEIRGREEDMNRGKICRVQNALAYMGTCALWHDRTTKAILRKKMVLISWEEVFSLKVFLSYIFPSGCGISSLLVNTLTKAVVWLYYTDHIQSRFCCCCYPKLLKTVLFLKIPKSSNCKKMFA